MAQPPTDDADARRDLSGATVARSRGEMPLVEHLRELRSRSLRAAAAVAVASTFGYLVFPRLLGVLLRPYCDVLATIDPDAACRLVALGPLDPLVVRLRGAVVIGLLIAAPVVLLQAWRFVRPGLTRRERGLAMPFVVLSQVMFLAGLAFAAVTIPLGLAVLLRFGGETIVPMLAAAEYLRFLLAMGVAFGVVFEVPLVLVFLVLMGVVDSHGLRRARSYAVVAIFVVAAIITPTVDALSLLLVAGPMIVFYEGAIVVARVVERGRRRRRPQ